MVRIFWLQTRIPFSKMKLKKSQQKELNEFVKKRKEIPIRFCYIGMAWNKIAIDPKYTLAKRELGILKKSVEFISSKTKKPVNILHLAVGNGVEIPYIVDAIGLKNINIYAIVDINKRMLNLAKSFVLKKYPRLNIKSYFRDIETEGIKDIANELKRNGAKRNLILLIGNGVLFSNNHVVKFIRESMKSEDKLFLTLELFKKSKQKETFDSYMIPPVINLLSIGVKRAGFKPEHEKFNIEYDSKTLRLKQFFQTNGKNLLVLSSYKPQNIQKIEKRLKKYGIKKEFLIENKKIHSSAGLFKI